MTIRVHSKNLILLNNLNRTGDRLATAMGRLSTGYRINSASDGAAELMLSKGLEKQISGLSVCNDNASMARNVLSVADGSLSQVTSMAQRIRDIALSSANGVYGEAERQAYQTEVDGLVEEIKRQVNDARYNDYKLFYGNTSPAIKTNAGAGGAGTSGTVGVQSVQKVSQEEAQAQGYTCVSTAQELKDALVAGDANCKVMLVADINLDDLGLDATGSNWSAVGASFADVFQGTLDGNGYTIRNLKINTSNNHRGLFGVTAENSSIKNLNIDNANIESTGSCAGVLAGSNQGTIENCSVTNATIKNNYERIGGLVGQNIGTISNCKAEANIEGKDLTGVFVGINFSTIVSSFASGNLQSEGTNTGGFAGANGCSGSYIGDIQNCSTSADVTGTGEFNIGGFAGSNQSTAKITSCFSTGKVDGSGEAIGGFVGNNFGDSITSCHSTGKVVGNGIFVGGFAGLAQQTCSIISCYSTGDVTGSEHNVGGFIGATIDESVVDSCYSTGKVVGNGENIGGFAGGAADNSTMTSCYSKGDVTGISQVGGFIGGDFSLKTLSLCYSTGNVTGTGNHTGGFAGAIGSTETVGVSLDSCYSTGNVTGASYTGGFIGTVQNGSVSNSYCTGSVTGNTSSTGDFIGQVHTGGTFTNYAYAVQSNGASLKANGIGTGAGNATGIITDAKKDTTWFEDKNNLISVVGENWDYSYFDSRLTFQIGVLAGANNILGVDLSFGVDDFEIDVMSQGSSRESLSEVDKLIEYVTNMQGKIGSAMNVMDSVLGNNTQTQINLTDSNSRLIDADVAKESAEFVKNQIRQNMTASLLTQTGTNMSQIVLALYGIK